MSLARAYEDFIGSLEPLFPGVRGVLPLRTGTKRRRSHHAATPSATRCRSFRNWFMLTRASGLMLLGLSGGCFLSTPLTNVKQASLETCIRKSCTGPQEARDYRSCEAVCRERFGQ